MIIEGWLLSGNYCLQWECEMYSFFFIIVVVTETKATTKIKSLAWQDKFLWPHYINNTKSYIAELLSFRSFENMARTWSNSSFQLSLIDLLYWPKTVDFFVDWTIWVINNFCWGLCKQSSADKIIIEKKERKIYFSGQCHTRCDHQLQVNADVIIH